MEWWAWIAWGVAIAAGVSGLVLGIRAERRATRYEPLWVTDTVGSSILFYNRTGEDATMVKVTLVGGSHFGPDTFRLVPNDQSIPVSPKQSGPTGGFNVIPYVEWTRPKTGKRYSYPRKRPEPPT